jgi:hypothetical protein
MEEGKITSFFDRLRQRPFSQRLLFFVLAVIAWFLFVSAVYPTDGDAIGSARSTYAYWLLSVGVLFVLATLLFKKKQ